MNKIKVLFFGPIFGWQILICDLHKPKQKFKQIISPSSKYRYFFLNICNMMNIIMPYQDQ